MAAVYFDVLASKFNIHLFLCETSCLLGGAPCKSYSTKFRRESQSDTK